MSDSLDDFFAKKDKKRGKDKPKAAALSSVALVKELEEGAKQVDYPVRKDNKSSNVVELLGLDANDTDWRDFEDVEKRDYTGLKVKEMSLQDQADEEQRRNSEHIEPLPESTPWRIKEESATNNDASNNSDAKQQKNDNVTTTTTKALDKTSDTFSAAAVSSSSSAANTLSSTTTPSTTDQTSSTTQSTTTDSQAAEDKLATSDGDKDPVVASDSKDDAKDDSKGDKPSAKAAYVPPHARLQSEFKILEPSKLGKSSNSRGRSGPIPNLQDEQSFPSLG